MLKEGLDESLGYWLGIVYRKMSTLFLHRIKEYDITPEQWSVLYRISEQDGLIQKEIAERAGKDKPTTTRILDALETKGFVRKQAEMTDRRCYRVFITEKGSDVAKRIAPIELKTIRDAAGDIPAAEYTQLMQLLRRINVNIDALLEQE